MKKIFNFTLMALLVLVFAACGKEDPFPGMGEGEGQLSTKKMMVKVERQENEVRASFDVASFIVDILKDGEVVESYTYSEMPEVITLPVGTYTVRARSGEVQPVAWEAPYFEGERQFTVKSKEITEVETIECKLANVRVSILYAEDLLQQMGDDCKVTVVMGDNASIEFSKNETRSAYFAYVPGSNTLVATFTGTVGNETREDFKAYTDVAPANHYKITYHFKKPDLPDDEGSITFNGVIIDATVTSEDLRVNVDPGEEEIIDPSDRPSEGGDEPGPGPGPDQPGDKTAPQVIIPEGSAIVFDQVMDIVDGSNYSLRMTSEAGFQHFNVEIDSPYLTEEFLNGVGMKTKFDLCNPGSLEEALKGFGLATGNEVSGQKSVDFDLSSLIPLLALDPESHVHNFIITLVDANGTTTKTLKFRN